MTGKPKSKHPDPANAKLWEERAQRLGVLERLITRYENDGKLRQARAFNWARLGLIDWDPRPLKALGHLDRNKPFPVTIEQFLEDTDFLGHMEDFRVWDAHWPGTP